VSQTFSIGIFAACLALTMKCEIVVFSPARRASRKLLERMVEFIRLLGHEPVEYNQGTCHHIV
jgi:tRNA(Met) C34 N-acetyltransferase TmcA